METAHRAGRTGTNKGSRIILGSRSTVYSSCTGKISFSNIGVCSERKKGRKETLWCYPKDKLVFLNIFVDVVGTYSTMHIFFCEKLTHTQIAGQMKA
jgi:hypothetical protein